MSQKDKAGKGLLGANSSVPDWEGGQARRLMKRKEQRKDAGKKARVKERTGVWEREGLKRSGQLDKIK